MEIRQSIWHSQGFITFESHRPAGTAQEIQHDQMLRETAHAKGAPCPYQWLGLLQSQEASLKHAAMQGVLMSIGAKTSHKECESASLANINVCLRSALAIFHHVLVSHRMLESAIEPSVPPIQNNGEHERAYFDKFQQAKVLKLIISWI